MIRFLKSFLPQAFKQFLWFVFKSPQRKWPALGYSTLWTDFIGWISTRYTPSELKPVTVCVGVKNRSKNLLNYVIESMNRCDHKDLLRLSVFDAGSDDMDNLKNAIDSHWKGDCTYSSESMKFARSICFNRAVRQAQDGLILVCDADMSLPKDIVNKVNQYCNSKSAWFPHVWYLNPDGSGRYYTESTGMMACRRSDYLKTGGMDESILEWGKEDWLLFFEFYKHGIACLRTNEPDFVHHYHESLKPENFQPLF